MKLGIMSDVHLGERKWARRSQDGINLWRSTTWNAFQNAVKTLIGNGIDALLVAGDLFDHPNPDAYDVMQLEVLSQVTVPVLVIAGNHDHNHMNEMSPVHFVSMVRIGNQTYVAHDEVLHVDIGNVRVHMVPYGMMGPEGIASVLECANGNDVLLAHGQLQTDGVEEEYAVPRDLAQRMSLTVLGHVHLPKVLKRGKHAVLQPGSVMPSAASFGMKHAEPSVWVWDSETSKISQYHVKGVPKLHRVHTDDVNMTLQVIAKSATGDAWSVLTEQSAADVDEATYREAILNSMSVALTTKETNVAQGVDAWNVRFEDWLREHYPSRVERIMSIQREVTNA